MKSRRIVAAAMLLLAMMQAEHAQTAVAGVFAIPPVTDIWRNLLQMISLNAGPLTGSPMP